MLSMLLGSTLYAQSEWVVSNKTIKIESSDGLSINNSADKCRIINMKAATYEEKSEHRISQRLGVLRVTDFYNDAKATQMAKKLVIDIHDDHCDLSNYRYRVYNESGGTEWVKNNLFWGLAVFFKGTDGGDYYVTSMYDNWGEKSTGLITQNEQTKIQTSGRLPGKGDFKEPWKQHYFLGDRMPDGLSITYQTDGTCLIEFGHSKPQKSFVINDVASISSIVFRMGSGAAITLSNYRVMKESIYAKAKPYLQQGDSYMQNEDYLNAAVAYSKAISLGYESYDVYYKRASAYYYAQFYNNSIDDYTKALSYKSTEEAYFYRGMSKLAKRDVSAIEDLLKGGTIGQAMAREMEVTAVTDTPESKYVGSGTGFFINPNGYIATNHHVVENAKGIDVLITKSGKAQTYQARSIIVDKTNDLAIIKIDDSDFVKMSSIPYSIGAGTKDVGTSVFAMGYPQLTHLGDEIKVTDGIISSKTGYKGDITTYQISAPIQPGNSGGPLFDKNGVVLGVTSSGVESLDNVGYAIKISYLKNLIEASPETIITPSVNELQGLSFTEKIKRISPYVVIIKVY